LDTEDLDRVSQPGVEFDRAGRRPMTLPSLVPKPVICAINGACAGLGLITALTSDIRFAAEEAKITTAFARRGLPAEEAVPWMLPRIVGHATALDLLLSSRVVLGSEAVRIGLVHQAFPREELVPSALTYAREMAANCSPVAMATAKRQVYQDWERPLLESQREARRLVGVLKESSADFREGVRSFIEKRPATFAPLSQAVAYPDDGSSPR
jgi:enoyl-CoA hydratase/carnithine racemase